MPSVAAGWVLGIRALVIGDGGLLPLPGSTTARWGGKAVNALESKGLKEGRKDKAMLEHWA